MFKWQPLWSTTEAVVTSLISLEGGLSNYFHFMGSSEIYYRSVHNTRIEPIWYDWTTQAGSWWVNFFVLLEERGGLDVDQPNHLWLLHKLFLNALNAHIVEFVQMWNDHIIRQAPASII